MKARGGREFRAIRDDLRGNVEQEHIKMAFRASRAFQKGGARYSVLIKHYSTYLTRVNCLNVVASQVSSRVLAGSMVLPRRLICSNESSTRNGSTSALGPPPRQPWIKNLRPMQAGECSLSSPTPAWRLLGRPHASQFNHATKRFCSAGKHPSFVFSLQYHCSSRADMI